MIELCKKISAKCQNERENKHLDWISLRLEKFIQKWTNKPVFYNKNTLPEHPFILFFPYAKNMHIFLEIT